MLPRRLGKSSQHCNSELVLAPTTVPGLSVTVSESSLGAGSTSFAKPKSSTFILAPQAAPADPQSFPETVPQS